ncbi:MoaD/ThiS family protein [Caldimonas sp. KR1-144]|uniref:MoaD/ThiS family protein n=1 Tax=Caldimonas sp. KR1-144 TaxID=3400911 RepID=UPI003BFFB3DA
MARVDFTPQLRRFTAAPGVDAPGAATLMQALAAAFELNPKLRGYVLDDQGQLRPNVAIYIDGHAIRDRRRLLDPLGAASRVYVAQALSGG